MTWNPNEDYGGVELTKCWHLLVPYTRGRVLDVGSGQNRCFSHWVTLDSGMDYGGKRIADIKADGSQPLPFVGGYFDAVVSSHYIEHVVDWRKAVAEWWRLVNVGGNLVLYWPAVNVPGGYPAVGEEGCNKDHKSDISDADLLDCMTGLGGWDCLEAETRLKKNEYSHFTVFRKRADFDQNFSPWRKAEKSAMVIRYGAIGDQFVASSILPLLKREGYRVSYNTVPQAADLLAGNPHIDEFVIQDIDQVRNEDLGEYWDRFSERYDRVIQLNESVEKTLLTTKDIVYDYWPQGVRSKICNINYLERTHDIAGVPHEFGGAGFFPTKAEEDRAQGIKDTINGPLVLWVLAGSSIHKIWPYMAQAVVRLLNTTNAHFMLAGDKRARALEDIIEKEVAGFFGEASRIIKTSDKWPIRGTLAMAKRADMVIGPETGVLNAIAHDPVKKIVLLSHSTEENLTKHWTNTTAIIPPNTPCYPCHRLHQDFSRCNKHEATGASLCQANIPITSVVDAIKGALNVV